MKTNLLLLLLLSGPFLSAQIFTEIPDTPFLDIAGGEMAFADVDGDNDMDVLFTGRINTIYYAILYTNDGAGNFSEVPDTPFEGVAGSSLAFEDIDGDNDADVLIVGFGDSGYSAKLYKNDGTGN